jgi:DHA1 family tetracycline resistance protein-like MFS transporter
VPLFVAAGLSAVNLVYASIVLREPQRHSSESPSSGVSRWAALARPGVATLSGANLLFSFAVTQLEAMFAFYMLDRFDFGARQVALVLVAMAVVMAGIQGGGMRRLVARYGEAKLVLFGLVLMSIAFALIPLTDHVGILMIPLMGAAVGRAVAQPPMMGLISLAAPAGERGSVMGVFQSSASLARILGPVTAGLLFDVHRSWPFFLASGLLLLDAGLIWRFVSDAPPSSGPGRVAPPPAQPGPSP